ncbi:MAG: hypothetical protein AAF074_13845 [Pseudomonadota bacterium]
MSPEPGPPADLKALARRNHGLRLAFAVALGLTIEISRGAILPPLAPVIGLQLLAMRRSVPTGGFVIGLLGVITAACLFAYAVATLTVGNTLLFAIGLGGIYLWSYAMALSPRTGPIGVMFLTMGIVVTTLSAVSTGLALYLVVELIVSVVIGIALVFAAHLVFAHPEAVAETPKRAGPATASLPVARQALLATLIMLPLHLYLSADGLAAMVILMTVATMLRQPGIAQSVRYGVTFAAGNLVGGVLASMAVLIVALHQSVTMLATVAAAGALLMAWSLDRSAAMAQILLPGFVAFTLLFGLAFAPVTLGAQVAFVERVSQIMVAALYALCATSLVAPLLTPRPRAAPT